MSSSTTTEKARSALENVSISADVPSHLLYPLDTLPKAAGATPESCVLDIFRLLIAQQVAQLSGASIDAVYAAVDAPRQVELADFAIPTPRLRLQGNPAQKAQEITSQFVVNDYITAASAAGPFMNFNINHAKLKELTLAQIFRHGANYGRNNSGAGKHVVVEFSSPNIAKPFHVGHLRSTIIGSFVRNVLEANGYKTTAVNYLGDWGKQYGLLAVGFERFGSEEELQRDPIRHLFDVYVKINKDAEADPTIHDEARAYFKKMEDGDKKALSLWQHFRDLSIVKYKEIYARLNIEFDVYSGESQVGEEMGRALVQLEEKGLLKEDKGARIIDMKKDKLEVVVVQKSDGTTLYITRDIGEVVERKQRFNFDKMIYVVAAQQDLHFKQLFKIIDRLGYPWVKDLTHINFGMVTGMSTRKGNVVFLEDILNATQEEMLRVMQQNEAKYAQIADPVAVSDLVGISAIFIQDMSARRVKDYEFNYSRMLSFEGDTGPYLQYAHARLCSIERKAGLSVPPSLADIDLSILSEPEVKTMVSLLAAYPEVIRAIPNGGYEPCNVVTYLFRLCHSVSSMVETLWVMNQPEQVQRARILLYWSARITLGNGLRILGLRPLERM